MSAPVAIATGAGDGKPRRRHVAPWQRQEARSGEDSQAEGRAARAKAVRASADAARFERALAVAMARGPS